MCKTLRGKGLGARRSLDITHLSLSNNREYSHVIEEEGKESRSWDLSHPPQATSGKHHGAMEGSGMVERSVKMELEAMCG
jgi:hypothetical protein